LSPATGRTVKCGDRPPGRAIAAGSTRGKVDALHNGARERTVARDPKQPRDVALLERAWNAAQGQAWGEAFELLSSADDETPLGREELSNLARPPICPGNPSSRSSTGNASTRRH